MSNVVQFPKMVEPTVDPLEVEVYQSDTGQKYLSVIKKYLTTEFLTIGEVFFVHVKKGFGSVFMIYVITNRNNTHEINDGNN